MKIHGYGDVNREWDRVIRSVHRFENYLQARMNNKDYGGEVDELLLGIFTDKVTDLIDVVYR